MDPVENVVAERIHSSNGRGFGRGWIGNFNPQPCSVTKERMFKQQQQRRFFTMPTEQVAAETKRSNPFTTSHTSPVHHHKHRTFTVHNDIYTETTERM
jgi:hypothetical protein